MPNALPDPDPELAPGAQVGEYEIVATLGRGAFGTVFEAVHPLIGKRVAIKVLARRFSVDPDIVSRFVAEARAVNQIRHRNIIDIFAFGQLTDGRHYHVMEHVEGETLAARLERDRRIPLAEALPILRGIGRALDAAHAKGIVHRDLKAENVLLAIDADGGVWPKLLDFGIAKLFGEEVAHKTQTGTPVGTPHYMSPEQCRGREVDHRTDLYAFGVLAYVVLTGELPLDADDHMSVLIRQMSDQPVPPSAVAPDLPPAIDDVIAWLMQKRAEDRPPNLKAACAALEAAAGAPRGLYDTAPVRTADTQVAAAVPRDTQLPHASLRGMRADELVAPPDRRRRAAWFALGGAVLLAVTIVAVLAVRGKPRVAAEPPPPPIAEPESEPPPTADPEPAPVVVVAPAPDAAPPTSVIVTIHGVPNGTRVSLAGVELGRAPGPVSLPAAATELTLILDARGHAPAALRVTPDRDQTITASLRKASPSARPKEKPEDAIIPVFDQGTP